MAEKHTLMNINNNNNLKGHYPVFLSEQLGLTDTINISYREIEKLRDKQWGSYWLPSEFSFENDRLDLQSAPDYERDVMVLNLLSQWQMDSLASRSIISTLAPFISNNEVESWFLAQSFFEDIHATTYAKIIRTCYPVDANALIERAKKDFNGINRSRKIGEVFAETNRLGALYTLGDYGYKPEQRREIKKQLLLNMVTLYALEAIAFVASFSCTFALAETGRYQAIGKSVGSIARDEQIHALGDLAVLNAMLSEPDYPEIYEEIKCEIKQVLDEVVIQELSWADYIFSDGRKILGLNTPLLKEYVCYLALPVYNKLGIEFTVDVKTPSKNPLPYMDKYLDMDLVQQANQEAPNNNYKVGQVEDDLDPNEIFDY